MTRSNLRNLLFHSRNFLRLPVKREDTALCLSSLIYLINQKFRYCSNKLGNFNTIFIDR